MMTTLGSLFFSSLLLIFSVFYPDSSRTQNVHSHEGQSTHISEDSLKLINQRYDEAWMQWRSSLFDLDIRQDMIIGEVGAGNGELAFLLAKRVGPDGHVYANEIDPSKLEIIQERIVSERIENLTPVLGQQNDALFLSSKLDLVILVEVYHHLENPGIFFKNLTQYLSDNGKVVIIDPDLNQPGGDPEGCYSDPTKTRAVFEKAGYEIQQFDYRNVLDLKFYILHASWNK